METHEIRREYLNPSIIPDTAPGFARRFEVATFRVEEIAPGLFGSLFNSRPACIGYCNISGPAILAAADAGTLKRTVAQ